MVAPGRAGARERIRSEVDPPRVLRRRFVQLEHPGELREILDIGQLVERRACVSRDYLESGWTTAELQSVITTDATRDRKALIPLMIDDTILETDLPPLARAWRSVYWSRPDEVAELLAHVKLGDWETSRG